MESFKEFELEGLDIIYGGKLDPTYITPHGDFYDTVRKRFVILSEH